MTIAKPDVTLTIGDADLVDLMVGKLNPQKAFFQVFGWGSVIPRLEKKRKEKKSASVWQGKLKIQGNMGLALKLQEFQKQAGDVIKSKL